MKGIRFYEELENKNRKGEKSKGTVVAVLYENSWIDHNRKDVMFDTISSLFDEPNSVVCGGIASRSYLWDNCRRISEAKAREIHPNLFQYLEM